MADPFEVDDDLEAEDDMGAELDEGAELADEGPADVDPMFAADVAEAFPDLDDAQIAALQRAVLGLLASSPMGGTPGPELPPAPGGDPFAGPIV